MLMRIHFDGQMARLGQAMTTFSLTTDRILATDVCTSPGGGGTFTDAHTTWPTSASFLK